MKKLMLLLLLSASATCLGMYKVQAALAKQERLEKKMDQLTRWLNACGSFKDGSDAKYTNDGIYREGSNSSMHKPCQKIRDEWVKVTNELYPDCEQE